MKDQHMPEAIQGLVDHATSVPSFPNKKNDCHTLTEAKDSDDRQVKEFEPRPNISAYSDDAKLEKEEKSFTKNFEPRPNISAYDDNGVGVKGEEAFGKSFEPRPNISYQG
ncbi:hypothetical protein Pfo_004709 [Paulownia fortunei]|nr:hypothetical protein Pfo_004709 [Paulownia fortunei]